MRLIVNCDPSLGATPLAGATALEQTCLALTPLTGLPPERYNSPSAVEGPLLWFEGLFPNIDIPALQAWFQGAESDCYWPASNSSNMGILYLANGTRCEDGLYNQHIARLTPVQPADLIAFKDRTQIGSMSQACYRRQAHRLIEAGANLIAPDLVWAEPCVTVSDGVTIHPNVHLRGSTEIGTGSTIDTGSILTNVTLAESVHIKAYCVLEDARIGNLAAIGPFAHIRPGSVLGAQVKVGNFVETKKVVMGQGSKASHLTYLGDATIGEDCNIGAGTITCNYDGYNKSLTELGDGVFIGSNSQLVAPVSLGDGSYVAAGSTVTKNVPADALAIGRSRQVNKEGLAASIRQKAKERKENSSQ